MKDFTKINSYFIKITNINISNTVIVVSREYSVK